MVVGAPDYIKERMIYLIKMTEWRKDKYTATQSTQNVWVDVITFDIPSSWNYPNLRWIQFQYHNDDGSNTEYIYIRILDGNTQVWPTEGNVKYTLGPNGTTTEKIEFVDAIQLTPGNTVRFQFMGSDSIQYINWIKMVGSRAFKVV